MITNAGKILCVIGGLGWKVRLVGNNRRLSLADWAIGVQSKAGCSYYRLVTSGMPWKRCSQLKATMSDFSYEQIR